MFPEESKIKIETLAKTLWGEARGEGADGLIGVGCVIRNRVNDPAWWGDDYLSVCLKSGQFSCWTQEKAALDALNVNKDIEGKQCMWVAIGIIYNFVYDITREADHYIARWMIDKGVAPKWAKTNKPVMAVGHHLFYKLGPQG